MKSIRFFLVLTLIAVLTLSIFIAALHGYRNSHMELQRLLDNELIERVRLLLAGAPDTERGILTDPDERRAFQVFRDSQLVWRSANAPAQAIAMQPGFADYNFASHRWHVYTQIDAQQGLHVSAAERIDIRNAVAEQIILQSVLPVVMVLPIGGILIWFIVGRGLAPLGELSRQLAERRADKLSPLALQMQPVELRTLVSSINALLQRLEDAFARERRFASDAAHELRTPIAALKLHLHNLLAERPDDAELTGLSSALTRMGDLVEQILTLYRTSPEHYATQWTQLDLAELVREVIGDMYPLLEECGIEVELTGQRTLLRGDRAALQTLLRNLFDNACKYAGSGKRLRVTVAAVDDGVQLQVEDAGPGVPDDQYSRIFEQFHRLHGDRHDSGVQGCGLGLSIVQHIVQLHGATIEAGPSRFDSGLAVKIVFPILHSTTKTES